MDSNDADTVTPLDGDGSNVTGLDEQFEPFDEATGNITAEHYETRGQTTVATRRGYRFASADKNIPVVTASGLKVTADTADALVKESNGLVYAVTDKED